MLEQEIQAAIQKNLPAQVAGELKNYIEKAEKAFEERALVEKSIQTLNANYLTERQRSSNLESSLKRVCEELDSYKTREANIKDAEHKLEIAELKIIHASDKALAITNIVNSVFSNRNFRYTEMVAESKSGYIPNNMSGGGISESTNRTITKEGQD